MPRHVVRTYGRSSQATNASKAFDAAMNKDKSKPSTSMATCSSNQRWGKLSFSSSRATTATSTCSSATVIDTSTDVVVQPRKGIQPRKGRRPVCSDDDGLGDPFSFDSGDEGPKAPRRGMGFKLSEKTQGVDQDFIFDVSDGDEQQDSGSSAMDYQPPAKQQKTYSSGNGSTSRVVKTYGSRAYLATSGASSASTMDSESDYVRKPAATYSRNTDSDNDFIRKPAIKSYSRQTDSDNDAAKKPATKTYSCNIDSDTLKSSAKTYSRPTKTFSSSQSSWSSCATTSADGTSKLVLTRRSESPDPTLLPTRNSSVGNGRKFFTSHKQAASEDHNYWHSSEESSQPDRDPAREDHTYFSPSKKENGSRRSSDSEFNYDSDWDHESGDPEIVFNSPKKKKVPTATLR